jgi:hypothetical protein
MLLPDVQGGRLDVGRVQEARVSAQIGIALRPAVNDDLDRVPEPLAHDRESKSMGAPRFERVGKEDEKRRAAG